MRSPEPKTEEIILGCLVGLAVTFGGEQIAHLSDRNELAFFSDLFRLWSAMQWI